MSDGMKAWAEEAAYDYYMENKDKDALKLKQYVESDEFKRLVELRVKFKELRELEALEYSAKRLLESVGRTVDEYRSEDYRMVKSEGK